MVHCWVLRDHAHGAGRGWCGLLAVVGGVGVVVLAGHIAVWGVGVARVLRTA